MASRHNTALAVIWRLACSEAYRKKESAARIGGESYGIIECAYCYEARANALWPDGGELALDPVVVV